MNKILIFFALLGLAGFVSAQTAIPAPNASSYILSGNAKRDKQQYDQALLDYNAALRFDPTSVIGYESRAYVYGLIGQSAKAIADYTMAIEFDPKQSYALYNRGLLYYAGKVYDHAEADFAATVRLEPRNANAVNALGLACYAQGKNDQALARYNTAIAMDGNQYSFWYNRALLYQTLGKYDIAANDYGKAISLNARAFEPWYGLGLLHYVTAKYRDYITDNDQVVRLKPDFAAAWNGRGVGYYTLGRFDDAITNYQQASVLDTKEPLYLVNLALAYAAKGDYASAAANYSMYKTHGAKTYLEDPHYTFLQKYIAACVDHLASNDYAGAIPLLEESLRQYKNAESSSSDVYTKNVYINVLAATAFAYQQSGNLDEALEHYQDAHTINPRIPAVESGLASVKQQVSARNNQDNTPPQIELLHPAVTRGQGIEADPDTKGRVLVSGRAHDNNKIAWVRVNGKNVDNLDPDGFFSTYVTDLAGRLVIQASDDKGNVEPGKDFVIAEVKQPRSVSDAAKISPIPPDAKPVFHAILIAESNYTSGSWPSLTHPKEEAESLYKVLTARYGFKDENIVKLYDKSCTDILSAMSSKIHSLGKNDNLVVLYAGHGDRDASNGVLTGYWVPVDGTNRDVNYISNKKLDELFAHTEANHVLIMSDACYSAAMRGNDDPNEGRLPSDEQFKYNSRSMLTSGGLEKVPDDSQFIRMLVQSLEQNTEPDISEIKLLSLISPGVSNSTGQLPRLYPFGTGSAGGAFFFVRK